MNSPIEKPLPQSLMNATMRIIEADDMPLSDRFEAVLLMVTGYGLYQQTESVDPTRFAIPQDQWTTIAQGLQDAQLRDGGTTVAAVNIALSWMNSGPSAYTGEGNGLCARCAVPEHDTCGMVAGCSCCHQTMTANDGLPEPTFEDREAQAAYDDEWIQRRS